MTARDLILVRPALLFGGLTAFSAACEGNLDAQAEQEIMDAGFDRQLPEVDELEPGHVAPGGASDLATEPDDGTYLTFQSPDGVVKVPYYVHEGQVHLAHDIVLGPEEEVLGKERSFGAISGNFGVPWPNGTVYYQFADVEDDGLWNPDDKQTVLETFAAFERIAPLKFVEATSGTRIVIKGWELSGGRSDSVGMAGGVQHLYFNDRCPTIYACGANVNKPTVAHELMHALGFFHEHQRPDRNEEVIYSPSCVGPKGDYSVEEVQGEFKKIQGELMHGEYDIDSIQQYASNSLCKLDGGSCECFPLVDTSLNTIPGPTEQCEAEDAAYEGEASCWLSPGDIAGLHALYGNFRGAKNEVADLLGYGMAVGDFDGDGYDDLAMGAPLEAKGAGARAGWVYTFKGLHGRPFTNWYDSEPGLTPFEFFGQEGLSDEGAWDLFGFAMTTGDFNGDGYDDLAVGAPGEDGSAGSVLLYKGSRGGLLPWQELTQATSGADPHEGGDQFGFALVAGSLRSGGADELVVGAPGELPGNLGNCGAAYVFSYDTGADEMVAWQALSPAIGLCQSGARFGHSLAVGESFGSYSEGGQSLAVGMPGYQGDQGRVVTYVTNSDAMSLDRILSQASPTDCNGGPGFQVGQNPLEAGDRFGASLDTGWTWADKTMLAVGAPGENGNTGQVTIFRGTQNCFERITELNQTGLGLNESGDQLGHSVLVHDLDSDGDLDVLAGAPGEVLGSGANARRSGWVFAYRGQAGDIVPWGAFGQNGIGANEDGDAFGWALAAGNFDRTHDDEVVVAAPQEDLGTVSDAGIGFLYHWDDAPNPWRGLHQNIRSPWASW